MSQILLNGLHYTPCGAGISRYTEQLLKTFIREDYDIDILMRKECIMEISDHRMISIDKEIGNSSTRRILEEQWFSRRSYKNYDIVHFPDYASPVLYNGKKVVTIHDMAMHTMKDKYTFMQNITKNILLRHTIGYADRLICVSQFSKQELLKYYPQVEDKVRVIYEGIDIPQVIEDKVKEDKILKALGIKEDFILYVGTIAPHKNITMLINAFAKIKKEATCYQLVIAGKKGWMYDEVFQEVSRLDLENDIIFTDYVDEYTLEVLYRRTKCFVSVSLYEGFGFPPLEAMGRGCPVVVSDIEVFKEVCGEQVLYCNPKDADDITRTIMHVLTNEALRKQLGMMGIQHVKQYTWEKAVHETYAVYKELLEG